MIRRQRPRPLGLAILAGAATLATLLACSSPGPAGVATVDRPVPPPRADQPDLAFQWAQLKRRPADPGFDTAAAYARAARSVRSLPRYSSRLGATLPRLSLPDGPGALIATAVSALGSWESLGPGNIGGRTRTLVVHPVTPRVMYAGGVSGGVWKTLDGGLGWTPIGDDLANIAVNAMAIHPLDPSILYVGTGEGYFREEVRGTGLPLRGAGIFVTRDAGASWEQLEGTTGEDFQWVNDLVISRHNTDRLYAATRTGVWRSANAGRTWRRILDPGVIGGCLDLVARTDGPTDRLLASCGTLDQATVYRIADAASEQSWESVLSPPGMGRTSLAIAPSDQNVVYALAASNLPGPDGVFEQGLLAVFRSTQGGAAGSWETRVGNTDPEKLHTLLLTNPIVAVQQECGGGAANQWVTMGWYANTIAVDPLDPDRVWVGGVDLFRSDDGGRSWGAASYWWADSKAPSFVHADQHALVFHPAYDGTTNRTLFATGDGGVFRTTDATAEVAHGTASLCTPSASSVPWESLNHGFGVTQFYHGVPTPDGASYLGGTQDNGTIRGRDSRGPDGWEEILGGDGGHVAVDPGNPRRIYAETQQFGFYVSTNGGLTFARSVQGITDPASTFLFITPFAADPSDHDRIWTGGRRMWRSENGGASWQRAGASLTGQGQVSAVAISPHDPDLVLAGTSDGRILRTTSATRATPSTVWGSAAPRPGFVSSVTFDPQQPAVAYASWAGFGGPHLWRSDDLGASWTAIDGNGELPDLPVHAVVVDPDLSSRLYLGTDLGVLVTLDGGRTWAAENTGFARVVTESLAPWVGPDGELVLYAFTHGRGAWRVPVRPAGGRPQPAPRRATGRVGAPVGP